MGGARSPETVGAFVEGLREFGYIDGKNITIDFRIAEGRVERVPELARELVQSKPDVIVAATNVTAVPVKQLTSEIPIVVLASHGGVESGLYASLARPGGNITGVESISPELDVKRLDLLKAVVPALSRVSVLYNASDPSIPHHVEAIARVARSLALEVRHYGVHSLPDFDQAFGALKRDNAQALLVLTDPLTFTRREQIAQFALENRIPGVFEYKPFVVRGGLMSYGPDLRDSFRRAGYYVDRILRGANPGEIPVEQPIKFELTLNAKTAEAMGITFPPSLMASADEVID
jgi:putative ABC transport system substrate-binding protein